MNGSDSGLTPAEQHLGDRLAALVDGELGHDARERVLSHLATCWSCKAEADAQRRLKNVFADTAPPPPSDGLMARLQGLPGLPAGDDTGTGPLDGGSRGSREKPGLFGRVGSGGSPLTFDYLPGGRGAGALTPERGFRVHTMDELGRTPSRSRRFAFVAAGAVSLAAIALSGALNPGTAGGTPVASSGDRGGASAGPTRPAASATTTDRDGRRRAASGDEAGRSQSTPSAPAATGPSVRARMLAGMSVPAGVHALLSGASSAFSPSLIRPVEVSRSFPTDKRMPIGAIPGRTPVAAAPNPAPAAPAATPHR